jgi:hypothetical protein
MLALRADAKDSSTYFIIKSYWRLSQRGFNIVIALLLAKFSTTA